MSKMSRPFDDGLEVTPTDGMIVTGNIDEYPMSILPLPSTQDTKTSFKPTTEEPRIIWGRLTMKRIIILVVSVVVVIGVVITIIAVVAVRKKKTDR